MGKSGFVPGQDERNFNYKYRIRGRKGVHKVLMNIHRIHEQRYQRTELNDFLIDLQRAIQIAELTSLENNVLIYKYDQVSNIHEIARIMNISTRQVKRLIKSACRKIADIFKQWDY
ncbi:Sigma-70, region 4 [Seinonella peptonophila]|uniref:Sigma-70, region 4 n=1 Tax=Seinonella peptonophila TaxID=112248 RepID=A0A1M4VDN2_9BACL|nr:sigma factor-like helix-turn-helix DNA-binding protein [Seinonella peptonophila]SHE67045.1 Sigma-70, region 4 [Seinonella peptonophila]